MLKKVFIRQGLIFNVNREHSWNFSHSQVPFPFLINQETLRIYYATRDKLNRCVATFIEVDPQNPKSIKYIHDKVCLGLGDLGMFDDKGAMISCVVKVGKKLYMYYTGWNVGVDTPYRLSIGLAISSDGGLNFRKYSEGPILDRSIFDPAYCCTPYVLKENDTWKMWYLSAVKWKRINGHPEPFYHVKYAKSSDGINWIRTGQVALDFNENIEAIGNHCVIKKNNGYEMYFSYRKATNYRTDPTAAYRLGFATSKDGIYFELRNDLFDLVGERGGWEKIMNAYPRLFIFKDWAYIFYNGDGFGKTGFGFATQKI